MQDFLSIGKVSKLKNVSIKSLRYYDEIGILKPAYVNHQTNYRYYKPEQLFIVDAITLCIDLGIPLKTLPSYRDSDGNWDFRKLLFDGKVLAEKRIRSMHNSLDTLQNTLKKIESGELDPKLLQPDTYTYEDTFNQVESPALPPNTYYETIKARHILVIPFDETTSPVRYNHKILELFVGANHAGLSAGYPTGLYYEAIGSKISRFVFVTLEKPVTTKLAATSKFFLKELPTADYLCSNVLNSQIEHASELFDTFFDPDKPYLLLETTAATSSPDKSLQLQFLSI